MPNCEICGTETTDNTVCADCRRRALGLERRKSHKGSRVVIALLATVVVCAAIFALAVVYFVRHTTVVTANRDGGRMEAPFGVITAGNQPQQLAKGLGLDLYPGAAGEKGAQAEMQNSTMVTMTFRTPDPPNRVIEFYHVRYPDATVKRHGQQITLVQVSLRDTLTIKAYPQNGHTEIAVSDISR